VISGLPALVRGRRRAPFSWAACHDKDEQSDDFSWPLDRDENQPREVSFFPLLFSSRQAWEMRKLLLN